MKASFQQIGNGGKTDTNKSSFPLRPVQTVTNRDSFPLNLESRLQEAWLQTQLPRLSEPQIKSKFFNDVESNNSKSNGGYEQKPNPSLGKRGRSPDAPFRRVGLNSSLEKLWSNTHSSSTLPSTSFASSGSNKDYESSLDGGAVNRQEAWRLLDNQTFTENDLMGEDFFKGLDGLHDAFDEMEDLLSGGGFELPSNGIWDESNKDNGDGEDPQSQLDLINELLQQSNTDSSVLDFNENLTQMYDNGLNLFNSSTEMTENRNTNANQNQDQDQKRISLEKFHAQEALEKIQRECERRKTVGKQRQAVDANSANGLNSKSSPNLNGTNEVCSEGKAVKTLINVAQAVVEGDMEKVHQLLTHLNSMASVYGDVSQRLSAYFLEGLIARMAKNSFDSDSPVLENALRLSKDTEIEEWEENISKCNAMSEEEKEKAATEPNQVSTCRHLLESFQVLVNSSPYLTFGQVAANSAILETFAGKNYVHIVDFGIGQGLHWPALLQALAARPHGPPHVRLTGIEPPKFIQNCQFPPAFCPIKAKHHLKAVADQWGVPFEFRVIHSRLEDVNMNMLELREGETVAVNCALRLHQLLCETEARTDACAHVLQTIKAIKPSICTIVEQSSNFNSPFFLARFYEALYYYFNVFESLDSAMPRASRERQVYEQYVLGHSIVNLVACEGGKERVERQENSEKWQKRMLSMGFLPKGISSGMIATVKALLQTYGGGYGVKAEEGNLTLFWGDKPLLVMSSWK